MSIADKPKRSDLIESKQYIIYKIAKKGVFWYNDNASGGEVL